MRLIKWLARQISTPEFDAQMADYDQRSGERRLRERGVTYPACNGGPCQQGRLLCPSPQACSTTFFIPAEVH